jgi:hypothetical protein
MVLSSWGFGATDPATDVRPYMQQVMNYVNSDSRIVAAVYWNYDGAGAHLLAVLGSTTNPRQLSAEGVLYAQYATTQVSPPGSGSSALPDFNGDGYADFADLYLPTGHFWVHASKQNGNTCPASGTFCGDNAAEGDVVAQSSDWGVLTADFDGDGWADYADVHLPSGQFWIHRNLHNGSFDPAYTWGASQAAGSGWELLAGDVDGDGHADLIEHQLSTGLLWALITGYPGHAGGAGTFTRAANGRSIGRTMVGPDWRTVIGNFTGGAPGSRRVDYADLHVPSGQFWVHENVAAWGTADFVFNTGDWGHGQTTAGSAWYPIFGDFTGDGFADFADLAVASGVFYIHQNYGNGTFAIPGLVPDWGVGYSTPGSTWQILGSH